MMHTHQWGFSIVSLLSNGVKGPILGREWRLIPLFISSAFLQSSFFGSVLVFSSLHQVKLMAENPDGRQEAVAAEAVSPDVLGAPSTLNQAYLDELKGTGVIFGGGDLERRYKVEAAHRGERVCFMNLDHPMKQHWLWVNEVKFTEFGIHVPYTDFQQRLLN
ncbi:hypothetical protein PIB30_069169 [Stylosanthes scabra]|uniref:Uncharacterized protein n=1 Tax=Stylosanthes scabra TaxID=79078 RepID=A0ABU6SPQ0_9FABA|nr:hypothetical protein [Stylosanthes scabra]